MVSDVLGRIWLVAKMHLADLRRRKLAVILLIALPPIFYFSLLGNPNDALALRAGMIGLSWAMACAALFSVLAAKSIDPRLVLAGFQPLELVLGRLILFIVYLATPFVLAIWVVMVIFSEPDDLTVLAMSLALAALIAIPLGLAIAMVLARELGGTLVIIGLVGLQLSLETDSAVARALPLYGPVRLLEIAAGSDAALRTPLISGLLYAATLFTVGFWWWYRGLPVRRPAIGAFRRANARIGQFARPMAATICVVTLTLWILEGEGREYRSQVASLPGSVPTEIPAPAATLEPTSTLEPNPEPDTSSDPDPAAVDDDAVNLIVPSSGPDSAAIDDDATDPIAPSSDTDSVAVDDDATDPIAPSSDSDSAAGDDPAGESSNVRVADQQVQANLTSWLPSDGDVPDWLVMSDDSSRTLEEVASRYADEDATIDLFESWGWQGNVIRDFEVADPSTYNFLDVGKVYASIHAFDSAVSAREAVDYSRDVQAAGINGPQSYSGSYGHYCQVLYGSMHYGDEITFLIQQDNLMIRLSASAREGDPTIQGESIMDAVVSRNAQTNPDPISASSTVATSESIGETSIVVSNEQSVDLMALLPTGDDVPDGFVVMNEGSLGEEEITASFNDPATASMLFSDWGWQDNAFRYFESSGGEATESGLIYVDVGIHQFSSAVGAAEALDYFCNVRQEQLLLSDAPMSLVGEQSRAVTGSTDMGVEATVYTRVGGVVIRVSVMSVGVDPMTDAIAIAEAIVAKVIV